MPMFLPTDILLPKKELMDRWAVIACDQFTSQPEYWDKVASVCEGVPSTFHMIFPEAYLESEDIGRIDQISAAMRTYLKDGVFDQYPDSLVYVERQLANGAIRQGIVGMCDLEEYDFHDEANAGIVATEKTVVERLPARISIRTNAPLETSHILLLCDDPEKQLIESFAARKDEMKLLYDIDLMMGGGRLSGWLITGSLAKDFLTLQEAYVASVQKRAGEEGRKPLYYAVGDGNHSLAAAKECYERLKRSNPSQSYANHPARYAMVELENIRCDALEFTPIHRVVNDTDPWRLLEALQTLDKKDGHPVKWFIGDQSGVMHLDATSGALPIQILQDFLDGYLEENQGFIDYIHGSDIVRKLARQDNAIGLALPPFAKEGLFTGIASKGVLPRKTFSMGHASEKRYYMEARKIKEDCEI